MGLLIVSWSRCGALCRSRRHRGSNCQYVIKYHVYMAAVNCLVSLRILSYHLQPKFYISSTERRGPSRLHCRSLFGGRVSPEAILYQALFPLDNMKDI